MVGFYTEDAHLTVDSMAMEELQHFEGETWGGTDK
jgi:hypothetical protein